MLVAPQCPLHLLDAPADDVVAQAVAEGVGHLVDVGVDLDSSRQAAANAARLPRGPAPPGAPPPHAAPAERRRLLADGRVVGVGETGLDYYRDNSPRPAQRAAFAAHMGLARELDQALG